ncbi:MAG TPA: discoidin domain-containing protein, partial [Phycisphaerae bacterium]|nr:discoidin domain-containing protein [Phycisphaerae bacterium]
MYDNDGNRQGEIGVTDLSTETSPAVMIDQGNYALGKWNFFAVTAAVGDTISIKLNALASNCTASMLSFDPPAGTRVSSVSITDQSTGSTLLTNDATVDVSISAATLDPVTVAAYIITESDVEPLPDDGNWVTSTNTTYSAACTYGGAEGTMTVWGWVKDSEGTIKGKSDTILYYPTAPVVTSVEGPYGSTDTTAVVAWTTDVPSISRMLFREPGAGEWTTTTMDTVPVTRHTRVLSGLLLELDYEYTFENNEVQDTVRTYTHLSTVPEIPKTMMSATASSDGGNAGRMIDGDARGVFFWSPSSPAYLRVDMGARYRIQMLGYKGNKNNEGIRDYEVYVTDSESGAKEDWGAPAITGQFPAAQGPRFNVDLIGSGRYLILWGTKHSVNMMSDEVWLSGVNLDPVVSSFTVSD